MMSLINELKNREQSDSPFSKYKYYEGIQGIRSIWIELTEDLKNIPKGEEVLVYTGIRESYERMLGLYEEFHKERMKRGVKYRLIYPKEEKELGDKRKNKPDYKQYRAKYIIHVYNCNALRIFQEQFLSQEE